MATYKNGVNGAFSGKIGSVVGASWRGIDYMRSLPALRAKDFSNKQKNQQFLLGMVSSWLKPLKSLIETGYQIFKMGKTPMNGCISYHMKHAVTGNAPLEYVIDFKRVIFSRGELLAPFIKEVTMLTDGVLYVNWENAGGSIFCNDDDRAVFVIYNPAKKAFVYVEEAAARIDKETMLQLPAEYNGDVIHCWQHFVNTAGDAVSTTVYLGDIIVG